MVKYKTPYYTIEVIDSNGFIQQMCTTDNSDKATYIMAALCKSFPKWKIRALLCKNKEVIVVHSHNCQKDGSF